LIISASNDLPDKNLRSDELFDHQNETRQSLDFQQSVKQIKRSSIPDAGLNIYTYSILFL
jgi:hypothetical protein